MKIFPKNGLPEFALPLPIFNSLHLADAICKMGDEFDVVVGLEKKYVDKLKELSLSDSDGELQTNTGDRERFGLGSYEEWYKKSRTLFAVIDKQTDALAALIWFGAKPLGKKSIKFGQQGEDEAQTEWHTISLRAYPPFRGRGIMQCFAEFAIETYRKNFPSIHFWAGMDDRNTPIRKLLTNLRFKINEEHSDLPNNWLVMTKK